MNYRLQVILYLVLIMFVPFAIVLNMGQNSAIVSSVNGELNIFQNNKVGESINLKQGEALGGIAPLVLDHAFFKLKEISVESSSYHVGEDPFLSNGYNGSGINVAIIDTGISDVIGLKGKVVYSKSFVTKSNGYDIDDLDTWDKYGHGTYVALTLASDPIKYETLRGIAPGVKIYNAKVISSEEHPYATNLGIKKAIEWSIKGPDKILGTEDDADIINLSLGGEAYRFDAFRNLINYYSKLGYIFVIAAGNSGELGTSPMSINTPGVVEGAITVGATDSSGQFPAYYSSAGPTPMLGVKPDILASGATLVAIDNETVYSGIGTSFAAPKVSGALAIILQFLNEHFSLNRVQRATLARLILFNSVNNNGNFGELWAGRGIIDLRIAYDLLVNNVNLTSLYDIFPTRIPCEIYRGLGVFPFFESVYLGDVYRVRFSLITFESGPLSVNVFGNISETLNVQLLDETVATQPFTTFTLNLKITNNTEYADKFYAGYISVGVGDLTARVNISYFLKEPKMRVLFDNRFSSIGYDYPYGRFMILSRILSTSNISVNLLFNETQLTQSDIVILLNPGTPYYTIYDVKVVPGINKTTINNYIDYIHSGGVVLYLGLGEPDADATVSSGLLNTFGLSIGKKFEKIISESGVITRLGEKYYVINIETRNPLTEGVSQIIFSGNLVYDMEATSNPVISYGNNNLSALVLYGNGAFILLPSPITLSNRAFYLGGQITFSTTNLVQNMVKLTRNLSLYPKVVIKDRSVIRGNTIVVHFENIVEGNITMRLLNRMTRDLVKYNLRVNDSTFDFQVELKVYGDHVVVSSSRYGNYTLVFMDTVFAEKSSHDPPTIHYIGDKRIEVFQISGIVKAGTIKIYDETGVYNFTITGYNIRTQVILRNDTTVLIDVYCLVEGTLADKVYTFRIEALDNDFNKYYITIQVVIHNNAYVLPLIALITGIIILTFIARQILIKKIKGLPIPIEQK